MRQRIYWLIFLALPLIANAQIERNSITIGGSASTAYLGNTIGADVFSIAIQPSYGVFIDDQILIGGQAIISYNFTELNNIGTLGLGPFARYYFSNGEYPSYWFAGLETSIATLVGDEISNTSIFLFPHVGFDYFFNNSIALDVQAGPSLLFSDISDEINLIAQAGFRIFLDKATLLASKEAAPVLGIGSIYLGGSSFRLNYNPDDGGETFASLSPNIGFFLSNKFSLGARAGFSYLQDRFSDFRITTFSIAPFIRYYFNQSRRAFFLEASAGLRGQTINSPLFPNFTTSGGQYSFGAGVNIFLTENAAIEGLLNYLDENFTRTSRFAFDIGFQYFIN